MTDYRPMASSTPVARLRDPFYVVKEKIQNAHGNISKEYDRWGDLLDSSRDNDDFTALTKSIRDALVGLRVDLVDLQRTNAIVEKNRSKFSSIDDVELASRIKFCTDTDTSIRTIEDHLNNPKVAKKTNKSRDQLLTGSKRPGQDSSSSSAVQQREQQLQMAREEEDAIAEDMSEAVSRLQNIAQEANRELIDQNIQIKALDGAVDHTKHNMDVVMAKLDTLLGSSDKGKLCCIASLVFLCVLLLILIVYT